MKMNIFQKIQQKDLDNRNKDKKFILSYGGGINSSALFFYLLENKYPLDLVIFADTGEESKETLNTVKMMIQECIKVKIPFQTVYSYLGSLYDYYFYKKKVPSIIKRDCTSKFKISPIRKHIRARFEKGTKFVMYIGIALEEMQRVKESDVKYIINSYPFVYNKIDRDGNKKILKKYNFKAAKSGCIGCIYNKKLEWIKMLKEDPKTFEKYKILDMQNTRYPKVTLCPNYKLEVLERNIKFQKSLNEFIDIDDTCDSGMGGCFL